MTNATLETLSRKTQIEALRKGTFDLLIIGGGATGAGAALDAASRGLKVAVIDKADFASGTSSKSTKLIHGGVRYLEQAFKSLDWGHLALVKEALAERKTLLTIAPHLTRSLPLLIPLYKRWQIPYYYAGLLCYDLLAGFRGIGRSFYMSVDKIKASFTSLKFDGMKGGIVYYDGQFNDARMNVELALTAQKHGAVIANYVSVDGFIKEGDKIAGCKMTDSVTGESFDVSATCVINATGPYTDKLREMDDAEAVPMVRTSAGTHIMVRGGIAPDDLGMLIPETTDGRVVFVLPWEGVTLIGTTDAEAPLEDDPKAQEEDIAFLLEQTNMYLSEDLTREDVLSAWTGLRPLVTAPDESTAKLSRSHVIHTSESGLITITGGKWTTYRNMAQDAVDAALKEAGLQAGECVTATTQTIGAQGYGDAVYALGKMALDENITAHLLHNYGANAPMVIVLAKEFPEGMERLAAGYEYIQAEVVYAVRYEMAQTISDVMSRRLRLSFVDSDAARAALPVVAKIMAKELGWKAAQVKEQVAKAEALL